MTGRRSLFLHVGLPHCGSSALQDWAGTNRELLAAQGLGWPETDDCGLMAARHRWLVSALRHGPDERLPAVLAGAAGDVLISAEGLTLHFHDFAPEHLAWFREETEGWDVRLILMTRDLSGWQRSMWKQCMINPPEEGMDFALDLDMADFAARPRVQKLTDLKGLRRDLAAGFGARDLIELSAQDNWMPKLARVIDIDATGATVPERRHESIADSVVPAVLRINALGAQGGPRDALLALMQDTLDTRNDTLRELARQQAAQPDPRTGTLAALLDELEAESRADPTTAWLFQAMAEQLERRKQEGTT
ncbi:hypothetical protein [Paracoccus chinensis]|uniref:Sulfotransferase family protein n=1 Tax=Paracoccus chinensis TaxID=525640 RepID=A0A1G9BYD0_9RHOB|nr:hypothetical protein [Paracoccus chinensis]SDK44486.1 hypothetical protein SAMN04487971_10126 [Paracoccus chinensis]